jgi:hypothetical protein
MSYMTWPWTGPVPAGILDGEEAQMNDALDGRLFCPERDAGVRDVVSGNGESRKVTDYLTGAGRPQAFMVTMGPGATVPAHFHRIDQYQLLLGGGGARYKGAELPSRTLTVHYADAFSTYGPIEAGAEAPMEFYTLRAVTDMFIAYMPAERDKLPATGRHRNIHVTVQTDDNGTAGRPAYEELIAETRDGLAAWRAGLGPAEPLQSGTPGGSGQYCYVISGSVLAAGKELGPKSLAWLPAGSPTDRAAAGQAGCDVLFLQFPRDTTRPPQGERRPE